MCDPALARVLRLIAGPGEVLFHRATGRNRTGIVAARLLLAAGVDRAIVVEDYARTATLLAELRERAVARG